MKAVNWAARRVRLLVDQTLNIVTGVMLVAMMGDVLFGIADRYILRIGTAWPEEVGRYLLIWVSFLAAALVVRHQAHFAVSYFVDAWASASLKRGLRLFAHVLTFSVGVSFVAAGGPLIETGALQISPGSEIPMSWVFAAVPVSGAFIVYYTVLHVVDELRTPRPADESTDKTLAGMPGISDTLEVPADVGARSTHMRT